MKSNSKRHRRACKRLRAFLNHRLCYINPTPQCAYREYSIHYLFRLWQTMDPNNRSLKVFIKYLQANP